MFYLELKDGDKFFTNKDSDDHKEFEKIIDSKLGKDAAELFDNLIKESEDNAEAFVLRIKNRYKDCINRLDRTLNSKELDKVALEEILAELQAIYLDYLL